MIAACGAVSKMLKKYLTNITYALLLIYVNCSFEKYLSVSVAALESRTWHPKEFRCYSQEKKKKLESSGLSFISK